MERIRDRRAAVAALVAAMLVARDALAAEGGLELMPDPRILALLLVLFAALVPLVNRLLLRPMLRVLDARAERTDGARRRASRLEEQVRETVARYERAILEVRQSSEGSRRELLEQARRRAGEEAAAARSDAELELSRVRTQLEASLGRARAGLRGQAQELAREAAGRVLGRSVE